MIDHLPKTFGFKEGAEKFPNMVVLSVSYKCNAKCPNCPYTEGNSDLRQKYKDTPFMSKEIYKKIADECGEFGAFIRLTGGGEPLLHKDMLSLIEYSKSKGARIWLNTNGSLLTENTVDRLLAANTDIIEVSVDAADPDTYSKVRTGLNFDRLKRNVNYLVNKRNQNKGETKIVVSVINQKLIEGKLKSIVNFWFNAGVDDVIKRKFLTWGNTTNLESSKSADQSPYLEKGSGVPCPWLFERINIDSRGKIELCGFDIAGRTNLGNVMETDIKQVWRGKEMERIRELHLQGRGDEIFPCNECPDYQYRSWEHCWEKVRKSAENHRKESII